MSQEKALDILKGAIFLEKKGKAFYENIAKQTRNESVRELFEMMAAEEETHVEILSKHQSSLKKDGKFKSEKLDANPEQISYKVLTKKIRDEISAASYESAAISAAMAMEDKAVQYYSSRAEDSKDTVERELFIWLANWEKTHLQFLSQVDKEIQESIWYDNQFWPM